MMPFLERELRLMARHPFMARQAAGWRQAALVNGVSAEIAGQLRADLDFLAHQFPGVAA